MKKAKRLLLIAVILIVLSSVCIPNEYRFPNELESIVSIQIMHRINPDSGDPTEYSFVKEMDTNEIPTFMDAVYSLETKKGGTPPRWSYGEYMAKITYTNGDMEFLGTHCIEFVCSGDSPSGIGAYYFADEDAFRNLIQQFLP